MAKQDIISLRHLATREEAQEIIDLLSASDIHGRIAVDSADLDYVLQGETSSHKFEIQINAVDQERAEEILSGEAAKLLDSIDPDYYLFQFSDAELLDILVKKNEWSEFDVLLSKKILNDRNVTVDSKEIEQKQEIRELELAEPEGGQTGWIVVGYISAFVGGFFGLLIGYFIWQAKNKLPNGTKVYAYNDTVRRHGKTIFFISLIIFPIAVLVRIFSEILIFSG